MLRRIFIPMTEVQPHCCRCCRQRWRNTRRRSFVGMRELVRLREELYREYPGWDNMVTSIGWEASSSVRWRERNTHGIRGKTCPGSADARLWGSGGPDGGVDRPGGR